MLTQSLSSPAEEAHQLPHFDHKRQPRQPWGRTRACILLALLEPSRWSRAPRLLLKWRSQRPACPMFPPVVRTMSQRPLLLQTSAILRLVPGSEVRSSNRESFRPECPHPLNCQCPTPCMLRDSLCSPQDQAWLELREAIWFTLRSTSKFQLQF